MPPVPEQLAPLLEKAPPQIQNYVKNVFALPENEAELRARSTACALAILSLWAISCFPYMAIFVAILVSLDPPSIEPLSAIAEPMLRDAFQKIPPMFIAPGAIGVIIVLYLLSWFSWYLGLVVSLLFLALAALSAADRVNNLWKKEAKFMKDPDTQAAPADAEPLHQD